MKMNHGIFADALEAASVGSWKVEKDEGREPRMYADATMLKLIGIDDATGMTPEEIHHAWADRVDHAHLDAIEEGTRYMAEGHHAEIQYPWHHPDGRTIIVRCGGVRDMSYTKGLRISGIHQWVTTMKHVDRELEAEQRELKESVRALERANRHERFRADALAYALRNDDIEQFVDYFSQHVLDLYGCDQVIYRDIEGRMILKDKPGTPALDFSLCKDCPHYAFDAEVYRGGFTAMDDCTVGYNGIPVHRDCPVRASLTYLVHDDEKVFGYIALHYLGRTHRFTDYEKETFDSIAKFISLVLRQRRHRAQLIQREGERAAEAKNQILSDVTRALFSYNLTVDLETGRYKLITGTGGEEAIAILKATTNYREAYAKMMARVRTEYQDRMRELVSFDYLSMNRGHTGYFRTEEYQTFGDDETALWGEVNVTFGRDADGRPVANLLARDITTARRAKALQDREIKAAQAKNEVLSGITQSLYSANLTVDLVADTFTLITGTGGRQLCEFVRSRLDRHYTEFVDGFIALVPEEHRNEVLRAFGRDVLLGHRHRRGHIGTWTIPWKAPDGTLQWLESNTFIGENEKGEPVANLLGRDVTAEIEQNLQQERERAAAVAKDRVLSEITKSFYGYNVTVNLSSLRCSVIKGTGCEGAVAIFDRCPTYGEVVKEFERRITDRESLRKTEELFGVDSIRRAVAEGRSGFIGSTVYPTESENPGEKGTVGWREASLFLGTDAEGNPIANILGRNITEEHARADAESQLLAEKQANRAKTQFLFNMSHDIRTPMNAIRGFTDIAKKSLDDRKTLIDCLDKIDGSGELLLSLINSVLDMSRVESGKAKLEEVECDVTESFKGVAATMGELAKVKGIDICFEIGDITDRYVYADPDHCNRVFVNIISNAIKYSKPHGWVKVRCEQIQTGFTGSKSDDESPVNPGNPVKNNVAWYCYTFEDNGIGMSEEFQGHVFEEFARERNSTTSGIQGTGLGLPLCKSFVELMGGRISCRSKQGTGTTFTVELPFRIRKTDVGRASVDGAAAVSVESGGFIEPALPSFVGKRVLLVEDNELNREVATYVLKEQGFKVDTAVNGQEAVDKVKKNFMISRLNDSSVDPADDGSREDSDSAASSSEIVESPYDLILMDIQMPVMDGYEATKAIRAFESTNSQQQSTSNPIPIIALSANAFAEDVAASLAAGMDGHVAKPIKTRELVACLTRFL